MASTKEPDSFSRPMNNPEKFLADYFDLYRKALSTDVSDQLLAFYGICTALRESGGKLLLAGNGASSAIAGHLSLDFTKQARVSAMSFNDPALITAFSNDYGQDEWVAQCIRHYARTGDVVVLISSSGTSKNIVQAAHLASEEGLRLVTFTGFSKENPVRGLGDLNFWIDSHSYQIVECMHMIWLTMVVDMLVGTREYGVSALK